MLIYSVTVNIESDLSNEWLSWMKSVHIPEVLDTGCFTSYKIFQVIQPAQEDQSVTFNVQYTCPNAKTLDLYFESFAPALQKKHTDKYEGKFVAFRSVLNDLT